MPEVRKLDDGKNGGRDPYSNVTPFYDIITGPLNKKVQEATFRRVSQKLSPNSGSRILEVACGTGSQAVMLAQDGYEVYALDRSPGMIKKCRDKSHKQALPNIMSILGDAERLPFPDSSFHGIIMQLALHELDASRRDGAMRELNRVACDSTIYFFVDFAPRKRFSLAKPVLALTERCMGWEHYSNGREFVRNGGLTAFVERHDLKIVESVSFLQGLVLLVVASRMG